MNWLFFAIFSRALYAAVNVIDKNLIEKRIPSTITYFLITGFLNLILLAIIPFHDIAIPPIPMLLLLLAAGALYFYGLLPYYSALAFEEASRVVPIWQLTPLFTLVIATLTVGEHFDTYDWIAFPLLVFGGFLISTRKNQGAIRVSRALWLMIASSLLFALWSVMAKYAYTQVAFIDGYFWMRMGAFASILPLLFYKTNRTALSAAVSRLGASVWGAIFANNLIALAALASLEYAIRIGSVSLTIALQGTQSFFLLLYAIVLSLWFPKILKEGLGKVVIAVKLVAILLISAGVWLISR